MFINIIKSWSYSLACMFLNIYIYMITICAPRYMYIYVYTCSVNASCYVYYGQHIRCQSRRCTVFLVCSERIVLLLILVLNVFLGRVYKTLWCPAGFLFLFCWWKFVLICFPPSRLCYLYASWSVVIITLWEVVRSPPIVVHTCNKARSVYH